MKPQTVTTSDNGAREALITLGKYLQDQGYCFVTATPATHARRVSNLASQGHKTARSLGDIFGWSLSFHAEAVNRQVLDLMRAADIVEEREGGLFASRVRFSTLADRLYVHSAYPTEGEASVFFGPDTYRFCALIRREIQHARRLVDVGCGAGAGGLCVAERCEEVILSDINPAALELAKVSSALSGVDATVVNSDVLSGVDGPIDVVVANPPYLLDDGKRTYREGGGQYGEGLALRILRETIERLGRAGTLIMYSGAAVVDGVDVFREAALPLLQKVRGRYRYEEIDPDVFGEELDKHAYQSVDRIAAVSLVLEMDS